MDEPDETLTVTLSVPSHARWQHQRRLWQPKVDGMRQNLAATTSSFHGLTWNANPPLDTRLGMATDA